jgi:D-aspartate ligase
MTLQKTSSNISEVIVTPGGYNSYGVMRAFGKRDIPVTYLDSGGAEPIGRSKYITKRLKIKYPTESETEFIRVLIKYGEQINGKMMIIPTGDVYVLTLSKHKHELEKYYHLPMPAFDIVQKLVNKKMFYKLLAEMDIPHPKTYFPESLTELHTKGLEIGYPFIIKPVYFYPFYTFFGEKNFVIRSRNEFLKAIERLKGRNLEVVLQELIPGKEIYMFYTYLNKKAEPLAVCGYDKIRQFPPNFGSGSFCKSKWRSSPVKECLRFLKAIKYHGYAEPELKRDPRDGKYKLLEINARTTTENRLAAACGADIEYISYLDAIGEFKKKPLTIRDGVFWIDDFNDARSCWMLLKRNEIGIGEVIKALIRPKVHSDFAWDDPAPFMIKVLGLGLSAFRRS